MTLAERVQLQRAEVQAEGTRGDTRVYCGCGCGTWWYRPIRRGRPIAYLDTHHRRVAKYRRTRQ